MTRRLALLVGNSRYQHPALAAWQRPEPDLTGLEATLCEPAVGNFDGALTLLDYPCQVVEREVKEFFRLRQRYDFLYLHLCGTVVVADELYFLTLDSDPEHLAETALSLTQLQKWLQRSFSRRQIIIFDCAYALAGEAPAGDDWRGQPAGLGALLSSGEGHRMVLATHSGLHQALAAGKGPPARSPFLLTAYLNEGLHTGAADADDDGLIGAGELFDFLGQRLTGLGDPRPHRWRVGMRDELIVLARRRLDVAPPGRKWDLVAGGVLAPLATLIIGGYENMLQAAGLAGVIFIFYVILYLAGDGPAGAWRLRGPVP